MDSQHAGSTSATNGTKSTLKAWARAYMALGCTPELFDESASTSAHRTVDVSPDPNLLNPVDVRSAWGRFPPDERLSNLIEEGSRQQSYDRKRLGGRGSSKGFRL